MKRLVASLALATSLAGSVILPLSPAFAVTRSTVPTQQTPGAGQALEIAPPIITLGGNPGQVITTQIELRDISSSNLLVSSQIDDFVAAGEDGTPKILLNGQTSPYSIKSWISAPAPFLMVPHQIRTLSVTIRVPSNASPGGHYGVIRFSAVPPELQGTGVSLSASLGSLVLFNVSGNIKDELTVAGFTVGQGNKTGSFFENGPVSFTERLQNTGNTQEEPTGQISISDMFGKKIAGVPVNQPPRNILPGSIRKFTQPLDASVIGNRRLFGHYTAKMMLTYGAKNQTLTATLGFWIIPWKLIVGVIVVIVGGFFVLRFAIKRYNAQIVARAQGTPKKKPTKKR